MLGPLFLFSAQLPVICTTNHRHSHIPPRLPASSTPHPPSQRRPAWITAAHAAAAAPPLGTNALPPTNVSDSEKNNPQITRRAFFVFENDFISQSSFGSLWMRMIFMFQCCSLLKCLPTCSIARFCCTLEKLRTENKAKNNNTVCL